MFCIENAVNPSCFWGLTGPPQGTLPLDPTYSKSTLILDIRTCKHSFLITMETCSSSQTSEYKSLLMCGGGPMVSLRHWFKSIIITYFAGHASMLRPVSFKCIKNPSTDLPFMLACIKTSKLFYCQKRSSCNHIS